MTTVEGNISDISTDISNRLPFSFGIDSSGNYGYKKEGADTVYPFSNGEPHYAYQYGLVKSNSRISTTLTVPAGCKLVIASCFVIIIYSYISHLNGNGFKYLIISGFTSSHFNPPFEQPNLGQAIEVNALL